jgi:hypothetical protein
LRGLEAVAALVSSAENRKIGAWHKTPLQRFVDLASRFLESRTLIRLGRKQRFRTKDPRTFGQKTGTQLVCKK